MAQYQEFLEANKVIMFELLVSINTNPTDCPLTEKQLLVLQELMKLAIQQDIDIIGISEGERCEPDQGESFGKSIFPTLNVTVPMPGGTAEPPQGRLSYRDGWKEGMREAAKIAAATKYDKRGKTGLWAYACDVISGTINMAAGISNVLTDPKTQPDDSERLARLRRQRDDAPLRYQDGVALAPMTNFQWIEVDFLFQQLDAALAAQDKRDQIIFNEGREFEKRAALAANPVLDELTAETERLNLYPHGQGAPQPDGPQPSFECPECGDTHLASFHTPPQLGDAERLAKIREFYQHAGLQDESRDIPIFLLRLLDAAQSALAERDQINFNEGRAFERAAMLAERTKITEEDIKRTNELADKYGWTSPSISEDEARRRATIENAYTRAFGQKGKP